MLSRAFIGLALAWAREEIAEAALDSAARDSAPAIAGGDQPEGATSDDR